MPQNPLVVASPAKVNLLLDVLSRRPDGYHEIHSLIAKVGLSDTLRFSDAPAGSVVLTCNHPAVPLDDRNLVRRAVAILRRETGCQAGCRIDIDKRIPVAGGMGGGSSNAASAMLALRRIWGLDLSVSRLRELGAEIGADVPFFFGPATSIVSGTGTACADTRLKWQGWLVLASCRLSVSTPEVYRRCTPNARPDSAERVQRLLHAADAHDLALAMHNDLEEAVFEVCPPVRALRDRLLSAGAVAARVSGAGSTVVEPFDERSEAESFAAQLGGGNGEHQVWVAAAPQGTQRPDDQGDDKGWTSPTSKSS
jgi:4-diphosphocytidyl-2-C-methyl-D-erythritol kinase